jgi:hypothetical protein
LHCTAGVSGPLAVADFRLDGLAFTQGERTLQDVTCDRVFAQERNARPALGVGEKGIPCPHHLWRAANAVVRAHRAAGAFRLFNRTTRNVALTSAGREYVEAIAPALSDIRDAAQAVADHGRKPTGTLRFSCSLAGGRQLLIGSGHPSYVNTKSLGSLLKGLLTSLQNITDVGPNFWILKTATHVGDFR